MLLGAYYSQNYAGIIYQGLVVKMQVIILEECVGIYSYGIIRFTASKSSLTMIYIIYMYVLHASIPKACRPV